MWRGLGLLSCDLQESVHPRVDRGRALHHRMRVRLDPISPLEHQLEQVSGRVGRVVPEHYFPGTQRLQALAAPDSVIGPLRTHGETCTARRQHAIALVTVVGDVFE